MDKLLSKYESLYKKGLITGGTIRLIRELSNNYENHNLIWRYLIYKRQLTNKE